MGCLKLNPVINFKNYETISGVILGKKTNVLLVRDDVGHAKPTTRTLPENDFSFGKPEILPDRDTVRKGISFQQLQSLF